MVVINFWICTYKDDARNIEYKGELEKRIDNLEDVVRSYASIDLKKNGFAIFKDGMEPYDEDEEHKFKLTYGCVERSKQCDLLVSCLKDKIFDSDDVNGIYITERKFSVWLKNKCEIKAFEEGLKVKLTPIKDERGPSDLDTEWTLGFFNKNYFQITDQFENGEEKHISTKYSKDIKRWVERKYCIRIDDAERAGILLSSNIIKEQDWREHNIDNRFVFTFIKVDLKQAKAVWSNLAIKIVESLFPRISNIYLAFAFYENQTLKIGIYLSGKLHLPNNQNKTNHDKAVEIRHHLKDIIDDICNRNVKVRITNAVPSFDSDFTEYKSEFRIYDEV